MTGFSFPPPPPPPPKQTPISSAPERGRGHGRGARGDFQSRGRGQPGGRGQAQTPRGRGQIHQRGSSTSFSGQTGPQSTFGQGNQACWQPALPAQQQWSSGVDHQSAGSPSRTIAGHKRKLDALRGPPQKKPEKTPAPATAPAIPTFGATFLSATTPMGSKSQTAAPLGKPQQKPTGRSLGLTPGAGDPQYSSSEDEDDGDDINEEAMYAELGDKLTFEHNGVVMSLNSQADLLAWKQERKKKWPTKSRMATKDEERRKVGQERRRLLAGVDALYGGRFSKRGSNIWTPEGAAEQAEASGPEQARPIESETDFDRAKRDITEKTKRLNELRRKVAESEARNRKLRESAEQKQSEAGDAGAVLPLDAHEAEDQPTPNAVVDYAASSESSVSDSNSSSEGDDSDDDGPPEETTSKQRTNLPFSIGTRPTCKYFLSDNGCRQGDACNFRHDATAQTQMKPERREHVRQDHHAPKLDRKSEEKKTILQRLVEQEEGEDDRLALKVVKYLGEAGFFR